jgi:hypothetical protein
MNNQNMNQSMNNNYMDIMMSNLLFSKMGDVLDLWTFKMPFIIIKLKINYYFLFIR